MHSLPHPVQTLDLRVREIRQLFNSLDPSPFLNKDLDRNCEAFIESWALSLPHKSRLQLRIQVEQLDCVTETGELLVEAIHNYYAQKASLVRAQLRQMLREGRTSLLIGTAFVSLCLGAAEAASTLLSGSAQAITRESLTIVGWVAMWRPAEIFLYDWWPLRGKIKVFENLRFARVTVAQA